MTRGDTTRFGTGLFAALAVALGLLSSTVLAAKPPAPPPPPPPAGTIYYRIGTVYYAMKADGSGQASNILPNIADLTAPNAGDANPAFSPSGSNATHDRWWVYPAVTGVYDHWIYADGTVSDNHPHLDLFAVRSDPLDRSQLITVQLTDLYGIATTAGATACWSNDTNNNPPSSFVTSYVYDLRGQFIEEEDGTTVVDLTQLGNKTHSLRFPLTISEIQPGYVPFGPGSADESELDAMLLPVMQGAGFSLSAGVLGNQGAIAPSGDFYLRIRSQSPGNQLLIENWQSGSQSILWNGSNGAPTKPWTAQWSPSGATVAIENNLSGSFLGGDIWTQPASGSAAPLKVLAATSKGTTTVTYQKPIWSPDNNYLVVVKNQYSGGTFTGRWLTRVSVADGKTIDLVSLPVPPSSNYPILRWTSDN